MKKRYIVLLFMAFNNIVNAQVGINTIAPNALLDISATNQVTPTNTDGLLVPRVDDFPIVNPTIDQDGMMIFLTTTIAANKPAGFYVWNNSNTEWLALRKVEATASNHYVGELFGGGIVCHVYDNGNHGIIASLADLDGGVGAAWGVSGVDAVGANSYYDGTANTAAIIAAGGLATEAAGLCDNYTAGGFTDWYLPSLYEIKLIIEHDILIDDILDNDGNPLTSGFTQEYTSVTKGSYWTSQQIAPDRGEMFAFLGYPYLQHLKSRLFSVRAIRTF